MSSPASSRSLILAWAMSRATTSGPVSDSRVFTGCLDSSARISGIGLVRSIFTAAPLPVPETPSVSASSWASVTSGEELPRVEFELLEEDASGG